MGKGDKKTKKGKIWSGTYGNSRKRKAKKKSYYAPDTSSENRLGGEVKPAVAATKRKATQTKVAKPKATSTAPKAKKTSAKTVKKVAKTQSKTVAKVKPSSPRKSASTPSKKKGSTE